MKNNEHKIIRTIKLNHYYFDSNVIRYDVDEENRLMGYIADSELLRIVEVLDGYKEIRNRKYLEGVITVKVGDYSADTLYKKIEDNDQILILNHCKKVYKDNGKYEWEETGKTEKFIRMIVNSSHIRQSKAVFVRVDLYEKIHRILLCGIDKYKNINGYPMYKKGAAKWSSYYGLACTDSIAVKKIPNIVVISDYEKSVTDTFDMVTQKKTIDKFWKESDGLKNKYKKEYSVKRGEQREKKIMPFDGAGLVNVECAKQWCKDLNVKGYIPAAWQFRAIPGIKGNVYTFDIEEFGKEHGFIIKDIIGAEHDIREEKIDLILTKSQVKFLDLYGGDIENWKKIFFEPVIFYKKDDNGNDTEEIECQYQRTFNICDYSENPKELDKQTRSAYQHLQTIKFTDEERKAYIQKTVDRVREISMNVDKFLQYRGCINEGDSYIPPYYLAASKMKKKHRQIMFSDPYFREKVADDIKAFKYRALAGKEIIDGNYQVLTPDIYGLAQYAFGERDDKQIGILLPCEVYSNWWLNYYGDVPEELAIVRNPHIFMEARVVKLVTEPTEDMEEAEQERRKEIFRWFQYQNTGIVTDAYSTIPLALGTADFDGDHVQTTNSVEYINAVKRAIEEGKGYTVDWISEGDKEEIQTVDVTDIQTLMKYDRLGYANNIGTVIDKVTVLWAIEQTDENTDTLMKYIAIADIIGQLTIDSAKTGEFEKFYEPIKEYIELVKAKTPYFKKYLQKYAEKAAKENRGLRNAEFFYSDDEKLKEEQREFSDTATNVNLICHDLEKAFEDIKEEIADMRFDVDKLLPIFMTDNISTKSELYKNVKAELLKLAEENGKIFLDSKDDESNDISNRYNWFYHHCRSALSKVCKLSEEKSIEKVVNILFWLCYCDDEVSSNNAKAVMWNAFGDELLQRVTNKPGKKEISTPKVGKGKSIKIKQKKKAELKKPSYTIDTDYVCFTENMWEYIKSVTKFYKSAGVWTKQVSDEDKKCLRKLAITLYVLSMGIRKDVVVKGKETVRKSAVVLYASANGKMNKTLLSKMCGFNDNQRKRMDSYLKWLAELGIIEIPKGKMSNLKIKMNYDDSCDFSKNLLNDEVKNSKDLYVISSHLFKLKRL